MITWQDLEEKQTESDRTAFVYTAINRHKRTDEYHTALVAEEYAAHRNTTIINYQKVLYTISGKAVPDNYSANHKVSSNFFDIFTTQQVQYLLGNGVFWEDEDTKDMLGPDFDVKLQEMAKNALIEGSAYGFFNLDHLEVFKLTEFVPLLDEETGALKAGIRFWQVDSRKPMRATLYEPDGFTEYIWNRRTGTDGILQEKRPYKLKIRTTPVDGIEILDGENYPGFPIVPMYGNRYRQSELVGVREEIDAYDLIKSGFANDLDDVSQIYWTLNGAGGMDDIDLARFVERMKTVKAAVVDDNGASAESHTIDVPYAARTALLDRLENDLYRDYMALNLKTITGGANTATQIRAAYEPLSSKADQFEYCVLNFLNGMMEAIGIRDNPTFIRSTIVNTTEEIQTIIQAGPYLSSEYITRRILAILGDSDKAEEVLAQMELDGANRFSQIPSTGG